MAQRALTPGNAAYCSECGSETLPDAAACARCGKAFEGSLGHRCLLEDRGIPEVSVVRVVREDLREVFPARRRFERLRDAQRCEPHHVDVRRDAQEGLHLLLVEGEDPGGP